MAAWTKAEFDTAYSIRVERHFGSHPGRTGRPEMRLHYNEWAIKPIMDRRWTELLKVISPPILTSDRILIVGAGFGWGVRALLERVSCTAIGTDISPYIQAEKAGDDAVEVDAAITTAGLNPTTGRGLFLRDRIRTTGQRAKELVLDEDMSTQQSRQNITGALGGAPTWIIPEDLVNDDMTDAEIVTLAGYLDQSSAKKVWLYTPTTARTSEALNVLTGHKIIEFGTYRIVG